MKHALLVYRDIETNMGDYTQSIAAKQFLPKVDTLISREELHNVKEDVVMILNGWFMHHPNNWPPSPHVYPRFVSFHINKHAQEKMTSKAALDFYKKHQPIGCRDLFTTNLLKDKGIYAYFSGCLTLTLNRNNFNPKPRKGVLFCDILSHKDDKYTGSSTKRLLKTLRNPHKIITNIIKKQKQKSVLKHNTQENEQLIKKLIPEHIRHNATYITNQNYTAKTHNEKFDASKKLLELYASAELVVTSRIHAALPCLAFGTPVVFIHPNRDNSRFEGLIDLFHTFTIETILNTDSDRLQKQFVEASKGNKNNYLALKQELLNLFKENPI